MVLKCCYPQSSFCGYLGLIRGAKILALVDIFINLSVLVFILLGGALGLSVTPLGYWALFLLTLVHPLTKILCNIFPHLKEPVQGPATEGSAAPEEAPGATEMKDVSMKESIRV